LRGRMGEWVANTDDSEVPLGQTVNSKGAIVFPGSYTESVQVTASSFSESTNWIARLLTGLRSELDIDFVADYVRVHRFSGMPASGCLSDSCLRNC
jgi:hypothetical protein